MSEYNKSTNISWANKTWNVIAGCEKVSPACTNCYAMHISNFGEKAGVAKFKDLTSIATNGKPVWTGKVNVGKEKMFNDPKRWKEPSVIFVNSMSDLFYEGVSEELIFKMLDKMMEYNWHKYLILTKREKRMKDMIDKYCDARNLTVLPDFIWVGVSVEDEKRAALRIPYLAGSRCSVKMCNTKGKVNEFNTILERVA